MTGNDTPPPCVLVIFGASGDLTARKLLPAIERLATFNRLPENFALVGVARTEMSDDAFRQHCATSAKQEPASAQWQRVLSSARYVSGGDDDAETYEKLRAVLAACDESLGTEGNYVYYFSTPPKLFASIAVMLGKSGLNTGARGGTGRAVIEKPFGWDEQSAKDLYVDVSSAFEEDDIFRIDHYLAKDTVQNLLALRHANAIF